MLREPPLRRGHRRHAGLRAPACSPSGSRPATPTGSTAIERRIERRVLDSATLLVAQSQWAATRCVDDYGIDADRVRIVPYGILMGERPDVAVGDPPIITWTGRSLERKGGARLLRMLAGAPRTARPAAPDHAGRGARRSPASRSSTT